MKKTESYTSLINPARIKTLLSFGLKGYLSEIGWFKSFETKSPIGRNSEPIPWVTYSFIDFIADRIQKDHTVFEFGSGNSTFYYAQRAQKVVSVEHDKAWYEKISAAKPLNSEMIFCELQKDGVYSKMPESMGLKFDIIIVDGRDRVNCCYHSLAALSERGVIVLDDSEREHYAAAISFFKSRDSGNYHSVESLRVFFIVSLLQCFTRTIIAWAFKMNNEILSADVKSAYDDFYLGRDEQWRMLGAKYKAKNIIDVCKGYEFKKVLEVGAGDGSILQHLDGTNFFPEMHALEISQSGVDQINSRKLKSLKSVNVFDGYHIPFADNEFDLVILAHVLEHVEFERMLLREIKRVSKHVIIEVPCDYRYGVDKRMKHFLNYGHINMYTPTSVRFLVQSEGFEVLADKVSMIEPEVTKFNTFINQGKAKSLLSSLRIDAEYFVKKLIVSLSGNRRAESFANAYTLFLRKNGDLDIFSH